MAAALEVRPHLSLKEIRERYRSCDDATAKMHWQIIWLKAQKKSTAKIAENCGFNCDWVRRIVRRYNAEGPESLGDRRRNNSRERLLDDEQYEALRIALSGRAPDGGLWNCRKVAQWIEQQVGHKVWVQTGWEYLHALGMTAQVPRPQHAKADMAKQEEFKKNATKTVEGAASQVR